MRAATLIVGGGPAGLAAAATLASGERSVLLVDRSPAPGGQTANWCCLATDRCQRCGLCLLHDVQQAVAGSELVQRVRANVSTISPSAGSFSARLDPVEGGGSARTVEAESVILATGFEPFDPTRGRPLGYGELDGVVTTVDVNRALRDDDISALRFTGGPRKHIAFLQCVGSRDPEAGRGYCSQACCQGALRVAKVLLHRHPGWSVTVFYMDLQIYGKTARSRFRELPEGLRFIQGVPAEVIPAETGGLRLAFHAPGGNLDHDTFDGVVLAVGMVPSRGSDALADDLGLARTVGGFLDPESAPQGVHVAGACAGPSFIEGSLLAGHRAAAAVLAHGPSAEAPRCERRVAVLGRGPEGTLAAEALSRLGIPVTLVALGAEAQPPEDCSLDLVVADELLELRGQPGELDLLLRVGDQVRRIAVHSLVLAPGIVLAPQVQATLTGFPTRSILELEGDLDRGESPGRLTLLLDPKGPAWRPAAAKAMAVATRAVQEQAAAVTALFEHVPLPGLWGQRRYDEARRAGVRFLRQLRPPVPADEGQPALLVTDAAVDERSALLPTDSVVPAELPGEDPLLGSLSRRCAVAPDREGLLGRGMVRMFPMRTERPGIWVMGSCREEAGETKLATEAAALAAHVLAFLTDEGRLGSEGAADIDSGRCVHCLTCVRICPHKAITAMSDRTPAVSVVACEACGACVAACPGEAISLANHPAPPTLSPGPSTLSPGPSVVLFACRNSGLPALEVAGLPEDALLVELPCGGAMTELHMLRAFLGGARRVLLLSCHPESCAHVDNHLRCAARARLLLATARRVGLPEGAFEHLTVAPSEGRRLAHHLDALERAHGPRNGGAP